MGEARSDAQQTDTLRLANASATRNRRNLAALLSMQARWGIIKN